MRTSLVFIGSILLALVSIGCDRSASPSPNPTAQTAGAGPGNPPSEQRRVSLSTIRAALELGRHQEALEMAQSYLVRNPHHAEALYLAAECLFALDQPAEAVQTLELIPAESTQFGLNALGRAADWYFHNGQPAKAERLFRQLIEVHGDVPLAHSRIALLMNSQGKRFEAMPHLLKLAELQDITRRELEGLVTISDQCNVQPVPGTTGNDAGLVEGDLRRARELGMAGDWEQALSLTDQLRREFPQSTAIAAYHGVLLANLQQVERLQVWHENLPDGIESQPEYWTAMASWMEQVGNLKAATRCASESIIRDPTNRLMYITLARALGALGDDDGARVADQRASVIGQTQRIFKWIASHEPTAADLARLGQAMLSLKRPFEALAWVRQAAQIDAADPEVAQLQQQLQAYQGPIDVADWIVCGLDVQRFPLPSIVPDQVGDNDSIALSESDTRIELIDVASARGVRFQYDPGNDQSDGSYLLHHMMGGGIGALDYDLDGWPDLYFSQAGGPAFGVGKLPNQLYRNLAGERFVDVTTTSRTGDLHYGMGVTTADWNQDGFVDLIVANIGPNTFYRNNGDGTFSQVEVPAWQNSDHWTSMILCSDLSGDSIPDLLECNYIDDENAITTRCTPQQRRCDPGKFKPAINRILRGRGDGTFTPWPAAQAIEREARFSLGVISANLDGQYGNDVFIANDTLENELWISRPDDLAGGDSYSLDEQSRLRGCAAGPLGERQGSMGIATGDFDHDGTCDMYVTNYYNEASNLYLQQTSGMFLDNAARYGARQPSYKMVGFSTQAIDLDHDGWLDLAVVNGHAVDRRDVGEPLQMVPQVFRGGATGFESLQLSDGYWNTPALGRTLARLDFDRDGRSDLVAGHLDAPIALLHNQSVASNGCQLELLGTTCQRDAVGTKITFHCDDQSWVTWVSAGDGYYSANEAIVDVGLGSATRIDRVVIDWASGMTEEIVDLQPNRRYLVVQGSGVGFLQQVP